MSVVKQVREPRADYLALEEPALLRGFELLATAEGGGAKLRSLIHSLAVRGLLVPQDKNDESAHQLLTNIGTAKNCLVAEGKLRPDKFSPNVPEADQPFTIPPSWTWARFGSVSINRDGERVPVSSEDRQQRAKVFDYYGASGVIDKIDGYLFDKTLLLIGEDGANLINRATPIAFLASGKYWVNNHAHVIDTTHPGLMEYLCLFINAISLEPYITGTAQPKMNQAKMNSIPIALPPLSEQHRIVARVEELMTLCDELEACGRLADEQHARLTTTLFDALTASDCAQTLADNWQRIATHFDLLLDRPQAIDALEQTILQLAVRGLLVPQDPDDEPAVTLQDRIRAERRSLLTNGTTKQNKNLPSADVSGHAFQLPDNWVWVHFDELVRADKPIAYGVLVPGVDTVDGVPFVRLADLSLDSPAVKPEKSIARDVDAQFLRTRLEGGEILMGVVGSIGKLGIAPDSWKGANIARAVCRIVPTSLVSKTYVLQLLQSDFMKSRFVGDTRKLAQPTLNIGLIRACLTPLPPLAEQHRIAARVEHLRRLCADLRERLNKVRATQTHLAEALVTESVQPQRGVRLS